MVTEPQALSPWALLQENFLGLIQLRKDEFSHICSLGLSTKSVLKTNYSFLKIEPHAVNSTELLVVCATTSCWKETRLGVWRFAFCFQLEKSLRFPSLVFLIGVTASRLRIPYFTMSLILCIAKKKKRKKWMTVNLGLMHARYSSKHFEVFNYLLYKQITEIERGIQGLSSNFVFLKTFPLILLISYQCLNLSLILSLPFNNTAICLSPSIATVGVGGGLCSHSF